MKKDDIAILQNVTKQSIASMSLEQISSLVLTLGHQLETNIKWESQLKSTLLLLSEETSIIRDYHRAAIIREAELQGKIKKIGRTTPDSNTNPDDTMLYAYKKIRSLDNDSKLAFAKSLLGLPTSEEAQE